MIVPGSVNPFFLGGAFEFVCDIVIANNTRNFNLRTAAISAGWDGSKPLTCSVTINVGVVVGSSSPGSYAFDTGGGYPQGSKLTLVNNGGYIVGAGGVGGNAGAATGQGGNGGPALNIGTAIRIINNGVIGGGGGGGAGGGNYWGGGGGGAGDSPGSGGAGAGGNANGNQGGLTEGGAGGVYYGGVGGGLGSSGGTAPTINQSGVGGYPGNAVVGNANATWIISGTIIGPIS